MAAPMNSSSSSTTCAACKHQRKRCRPDCILRKHFPVNRSNEFKEIHKRFGIGNVRKIIEKVNSEEARKEVVKSLYWEAEMWTKNPVQGPYGYYKKLERELSLYRNRDNQLLQVTQGINRLPLSGMVMNTNTHLMDNYAATNWVQENQDFSVTGGGVSTLPVDNQSRFMMQQQQHDHQAAIQGWRDAVIDPPGVVRFGNGRTGFESDNNNVSLNHSQNMRRMNERYNLFLNQHR